jgi:hypothetical protein
MGETVESEKKINAIFLDLWTKSYPSVQEQNSIPNYFCNLPIDKKNL